MDFITKETYKNNNIEVIVDDNGTFWPSENHMKEKFDHKHLRAITLKCLSEYRKQRQELVNCNHYQLSEYFYTKN